jgi:hydroxymethylpyrimidine/phosphomethylpyrimidine kinase
MKRSMERAALTIAGLDPSGGAGIAADLRSFARAGVWGAAACSVLTVQSTRGLRAAVAVAPRLLARQIEEVLGDLAIGAIKIGALGSATNAGIVLRTLAKRAIPLVFDPVMRPSRARSASARLDGKDALGAYRRLAGAATLVTPNRSEAAMLLGVRGPIADRNAADAAVELLSMGSRAVLVKGGHGGGEMAIDWLALAGGRVVTIARPRLAIPAVHGAGCTLSSLIAGRLAAIGKGAPKDETIIEAVRWARKNIDAALATPIAVGDGLAVIEVTRRARAARSLKE